MRDTRVAAGHNVYVIPPRAPFAHHAASLLVWQDGIHGPAVLMGVRGAGARFVPNRLVFPGGRVDPTDGNAHAATEPRPEVLALLGLARPRLARAILHAAARELTEETGLSLGTPPRLDTMDHLCRAVTPPRQPMRFNARFLVVHARETSGVLTDTPELHDLRYVPVGETDTLGLMLVTAEVLRQFQLWLALPEAARRSRVEAPLFRERNWRRETLLR